MDNDILNFCELYDENGKQNIKSGNIKDIIRLCGIITTEENIENYMKKQNLGGFLDFKEVVRIINEYPEEFTKEDVISSFKVLDTNKNGFIDTKDLKMLISVSKQKLTEDEKDIFFKNISQSNLSGLDYVKYVNK